MYTLVERCCGSAALTFHLLGAKRAVVPYQGGKWRYRRELTALLAELGFHGPPSRVVLTDPGPWGRVVRVLLDLPHGSRREAGSILSRLTRTDPRGVYDCLQGAQAAPQDDPSIDGPAAFAAEFLFLQRLAHSGKAVGLTPEGKWASPGFNKTSAYGVAATDKFGLVRPMIPALVEVIRAYDRDLPALAADDVLTSDGEIAFEAVGPVVEYIDPPYEGTTKYPNGHLDRAEVVALALAAQARGATVLVSEAAPVAELVELVERGWTTRCLRAGRSSGASPFKSGKAEWITYTSGAT
jgi:hypothetical protein